MKIFEHSQNKILAAGIFKRALKHAGDVSSEVNFLCITQVAITILYYKLTQGNIKPGSGCQQLPYRRAACRQPENAETNQSTSSPAIIYEGARKQHKTQSCVKHGKEAG